MNITLQKPPPSCENRLIALQGTLRLFFGRGGAALIH
jgi:hypothetical protein